MLPYIRTERKKGFLYLARQSVAFINGRMTCVLEGTLNFTKTALGRTLLRSWLLRPSISIPVIKARHDAVECFLNPQNLVSSGIIHGHLRGIRNVPRLLANMKSGKGKLPDWQGLVKVRVIFF